MMVVLLAHGIYFLIFTFDQEYFRRLLVDFSCCIGMSNNVRLHFAVLAEQTSTFTNLINSVLKMFIKR